VSEECVTTSGAELYTTGCHDGFKIEFGALECGRA
jgi:hypothetical protein